MTSDVFGRIGERLTRYRDTYRRRRIPGPSFYAKLAERKRLADLVRANRGVSQGPIYDIETKIGQKEVARKAGVRTAEILQGPYDDLGRFDLDALPGRFVVKPLVGSGANGVFLLEKSGAQLVNIVSGERYPADLTHLRKVGLERFDGVPLIAEDLIEAGGQPSMNWKVFAFYGEVGFVRQLELNSAMKKKYKMWSAEGRDIGRIDLHGFAYVSALPPPRNFAALVKAAEAVSRSVPTPFMRVDLYESDDDIFLGEVTLRPGSLWKSNSLQKFNPEWDRKLGKMWEAAEARLIEDIGQAYLP